MPDQSPDDSADVEAVPPGLSPGEHADAPNSNTSGSDNSLWGNLYFYSQYIVLVAIPVAVYGLIFDRAEWHLNVRWWVLAGSLMAFSNWLHQLLGERVGNPLPEKSGEPVGRPYRAVISWAVFGASMGWVDHLLADGGSSTQTILWAWAVLIGLLGIGNVLWQFLPWSDH